MKQTNEIPTGLLIDAVKRLKIHDFMDCGDCPLTHICADDNETPCDVTADIFKNALIEKLKELED